MLKRTNVLRTAALCVALCAAPLYTYADTVFDNITAYMKKTVSAEDIALLEQRIAAIQESLSIFIDTTMAAARENILAGTVNNIDNEVQIFKTLMEQMGRLERDCFIVSIIGNEEINKAIANAFRPAANYSWILEMDINECIEMINSRI